MMKTLIFPSGYYHTKEVDPDMRDEYEAAMETGLFHVILFDFDRWYREGKVFLQEKSAEKVTAVYRGWMMTPEQYREFYRQMLEQHVRLVTEPEAYETMHVFPNAYHFFVGDTARMLVYPLHQQIDLAEVRRHFSRFMVKDYVKSVKGTDFPKYFDATVTQSEFDDWMEKFYAYRGGLLTGGICVKEFLSLKRYGGCANEYRVFYIHGEAVSVSENSGQGNYTSRPPTSMIERYAKLPSPFYTVDLAELEDGKWVVIEAGDGQVSGLSDHQDALAFYRALHYAMP